MQRLLCLDNTCRSLAAAAARNLALHPENGHYLVWHGKPTILITSGEHYGGVLSRDFDYVKYFDTSPGWASITIQRRVASRSALASKTTHWPRCRADSSVRGRSRAASYRNGGESST